MNMPISLRKKVTIVFTYLIVLISPNIFAFSEFDGICGDAWIFVPGKYKKYYAEFYKKNAEYRKQCDQYGSTSKEYYACSDKVHIWYEQNSSAIQAREKADGEAYDARRQQCIGQQKALRNQQEARDAALKQQQKLQERQEQVRRQANEQALAQSNAERDAYNRAAEERNRQAQQRYAEQQRAYAAQQAEITNQAQIQAQRQAEIAAAQQQSETQFRNAMHDIQMQSLEQNAQNSEERYSAAVARNEGVNDRYQGQSEQLSDIMEQVRAKAAVKLAAAKQAVTGDTPALRSDVGKVLATTLSANVGLNNQNSLSNGFTAAAITGMGEIGSSALNQIDQVFSEADAQINSEKRSSSNNSSSYDAENSSLKAEIKHYTDSATGADNQQENQIKNSQNNELVSDTQQNHLMAMQIVSKPNQGEVINNQQTVFIASDNNTQVEAGDLKDVHERVSSCKSPNMSQISADLPPHALASLVELRKRLDIAISDYKAYCKNDTDYSQTLSELSQAREQTQKACEQISVNGICQ